MKNARLLSLLVLGAALGAGEPCAAAALIYSLVAPSATGGPGGTVEVQLAVLNPSPAEATFAVPPALSGWVVGATGRWEVLVRSDGAAAAGRAVAPGGFALVPLSFELPAEATGQLVLELDQPVPLRLVLPPAAPLSAHGPAGLSVTRAPASLIERRTAATHLKNYFASNFAPYEPFYFLCGSGAPAAKFQISFKYRLPLDDGWLARRLPQMRGLHFAYTQRTLWDLRGQSSPFYDTSYLPELFYQFAAPEPERPGPVTWLGWQDGVQHESNGKSGADSRSMSIVYARTAFAFGNLDGWHLIVAPRVFTYLGDRFDNPNIADYRGWADLHAVFGRNTGPALSLYGRTGRGFRHGAWQADFTVPTSMFSGSFATYLLIQYWSGYGESLLHYDRRTDIARAGFSLVR